MPPAITKYSAVIVTPPIVVTVESRKFDLIVTWQSPKMRNHYDADYPFFLQLHFGCAIIGCEVFQIKRKCATGLPPDWQRSHWRETGKPVIRGPKPRKDPQKKKTWGPSGSRPGGTPPGKGGLHKGNRGNQPATPMLGAKKPAKKIKFFFFGGAPPKIV